MFDVSVSYWHFEHDITFVNTVLVQKMSNQQYEIMMCYII